jgi:hypothetical protein
MPILPLQLDNSQSCHGKPNPRSIKADAIPEASNNLVQNLPANLSMLLAAIRRLQENPELANQLKARYGWMRAPTSHRSQDHNDNEIDGGDGVEASTERLEPQSETTT